MHKIFWTPELLDEVFSYSSGHTNTVTARVCKLWFTHSVGFIWRTVDLDNALCVLSSFGTTPAKMNGFKELPSPQSYIRFFLYSKNVRYLKCFNINYVALTQAALWRPSTDLFSSKLAILHWKGAGKHIDCLPSLLTSTLQVLHISLDAITNPDMMDTLCKTIPIRSPSLRLFELNVPSMTNRVLVSSSLDKLIQHLLGLTSLAIPIHFVTPGLLTSLSRLPRLSDLELSSIEVDLCVSYVEGLIERETKVDENVKEYTPFNVLHNIIFDDALEKQCFSTAKAFGLGIQFPNLASMTCCPRCETPDQIINLMGQIHTVCPKLRAIKLTGANCEFNNLPMQAIQMLLQCQELNSLEVFNFCVDMELEDIVGVSINRTSWKTVRLHSSKDVSYQALVAFAQNCPELVELGLLLDSTLGIPDIETFETEVRFSSLVTLDVGSSKVTSGEIVEVGIFLAAICGNSLEIEAAGEYLSSWKAVEKMVDSFTEAHLENQELKEEVDLLRNSVSEMKTELALLRESISKQPASESTSV